MSPDEFEKATRRVDELRLLAAKRGIDIDKELAESFDIDLWLIEAEKILAEA